MVHCLPIGLKNLKHHGHKHTHATAKTTNVASSQKISFQNHRIIHLVPKIIKLNNQNLFTTPIKNPKSFPKLS
jgi:hypothetical protein